MFLQEKRLTSDREKRTTINGWDNLKMIKSKGGREAIKKMDQKLCLMIVKYQKKLQKDGVNVASEVADADIIDVPDSDNENNNNYVNLDTLGGTVGGGVFEA